MHRLKEEKRRQERKLRKKMDALRYAMKHLDPPVNAEDTWEVVMPRIEHLPEYQAIDSEQARIEAFEKFIKRLKVRKKELFLYIYILMEFLLLIGETNGAG